MGSKRAASDEHYLINLCDDVLGRIASRQHRFDFLLGDPSKATQRCARLPVDAYYNDINLVVEVMERQHDEPAAFFDRRETVSGVPRGEQRRIYDRRRVDLLPKHGIRLVVLEIAKFAVTSRKKLRRIADQDREIVRAHLAPFMKI